MIDYNSWKRIKLKPTSLKLDNENLRLSGFDRKPSERDIIHYMVENERILHLAKSISQKGFFPNEEPIVYKDGNHYVVVEGNRRVTACKLLIQPTSAPANKARSFEKAAMGFDLEIIRSLYCRVAPSKEDADILVENRHTNTEIEKWDRIKQYRFYYLKYKDGKSIEYLASRFSRAVSEISKMIRRYEMFEMSKKLEAGDDVENFLKNETKLDITNLERFYESKQGRNFLGLIFNADGSITHTIPQEEFVKRYRKIIEDFSAGELYSRTYGNSDEQNENYIKRIFETETELDIEIMPSDEVESYEFDEKPTDEVESEDKPKKPTSGKSSSTLIPNSWICNTEIERINKICSELQKLTLGNKPNAALVLFRSFLEMVTYQYLERKGVIVQVKKAAGEELKKEAEKRRNRLNESLIHDLKIEEGSISHNFLKKVVPQHSLNKDWTPSLYRMLDFIASLDLDLTKSPKMKEGLQQYLKKKGDLLNHHDFNQFVHNEYSITPSPKEINEDWSGVKPLLKHMIEELDINKPPQQQD